jgi:hypothetical protein
MAREAAFKSSFELNSHRTGAMWSVPKPLPALQSPLRIPPSPYEERSITTQKLANAFQIQGVLQKDHTPF